MQKVVQYRRASTVHRGGRIHEIFLRIWSQVIHFARVLEAKLSLIKFASTVAAFIAFLFVSPCLFFMYTGIKCWRICVGWYALKMADEGIEELTGVTVRSVMEEEDSDSNPAGGIETLIFCLSGTPHISYLRKKIQEDIIDRRDSDGKILHPNFHRRVEKFCGYYAWAKHSNFDIAKHVVLAPQHYRGRMITTRNIQEYIGEVISQPLSKELPPWCVHIVSITDGGSEGEGETWFVAKAHHLLAMHLSFPNSLVTAYPDPWQNPATRGLKLLSAPEATRRFVTLMNNGIKSAITIAMYHVKLWWHARCSAILRPIQNALEDSFHMAYKTVPHQVDLSSNFIRQVNIMAAFLYILWKRSHENLNSFIATIQSYFHIECVYHIFITMCINLVHLIWFMFLWLVKFPLLAWLMGKHIHAWVSVAQCSEEYKIVKDAMIEIYWMTRAFVTLPRLVFEEALSIRGVTPLMGWVGRRQRTLSSRGLGRTGGVAMAWSDPVPLSTAKGVRGATGATLSEILMTACSGAVRDYLRVTGLPVPDEVSCTVPVYSQRWVKNQEETKTPGLVTLALPTGAADASSALKTLRNSMEKIRKYPERYLASVWLMRNVAYFLPESLLGLVFKALSVRYPVVMSNLAGPSKGTKIWGSHLLNIFYWRPPQSGSVISVCVTSYQGHAHLGVMADGRMVPKAATIPQAFVTHLNELAVDTGVRLVRQGSRCWSRSSSPGNTPSTTPPPTPTFSHKITFPHWNKPKLSGKAVRRQSSVF